MVAMGRADGADVEYHVASYLISQDNSLANLVVDPDLPFSSTGFHLSSLSQPQLMAELDNFMLHNPEKIRQLKAKHQLKDRLPDMTKPEVSKE